MAKLQYLQYLSSHLSGKGQLLCHFIQDVLNLPQLQLSSHFHNDTAIADRCHIVVNGSLTPTHTVTQTFACDWLKWATDAPAGKCGPGIHLAVDG